MNFVGLSKKGMHTRPNFDEQIPDVMEGIGLKKKIPERSAVFLRRSPQMSQFYDETLTDLQKSSQDQMTEEMKLNMIRQMAGQSVSAASAVSETRSELLRRLRPVWLDRPPPPGTSQFFDIAVDGHGPCGRGCHGYHCQCCCWGRWNGTERNGTNVR